MARNKVEFIITSEDSKAIQQLNKLLEKTREMGDGLDQAGKKGKNSFEKMQSSAVNFVVGLASIGTAVKIATEALDIMQDKVRGIREEMERTGRTNQTFVDAFGRLLSNMPGAGPRESVALEAKLRQIAAASGGGEGTLADITDALATVKSSVPSMSEKQQLEVIREVAQARRLDRTVNVSGVSMGYAKVLEADPALTANQAQNLMFQMQELGQVKDPGKVSEMIPVLGSAARTGGTSINDAQALAARVTQIIGDTMGSQSATLVQNLSTRIMTAGSMVKDLTGISLQGNFIDRILQVADARSSGQIDDDSWRKVMSAVGAEGAAGGAVLQTLATPDGRAKLQDDLRKMNDPVLRSGDLVANAILAKRAIPGGAALDDLMAAEARVEANRAGNDLMSSIEYDTQAYKIQLESEARPPREIKRGTRAYRALRELGIEDDEYVRKRAEFYQEEGRGITRAPIYQMELFAIENKWGRGRAEVRRAIEEGAAVNSSVKIIQEEALRLSKRAPSTRMNFNMDQ